MKKTIKLTENDINNLVKRVINEQEMMNKEASGEADYVLAKGDDGFMYVMKISTGEILGRKPL